MTLRSRGKKFLDRWLRYRRMRLAITRSGWWYLGFTLAVGLAGINTGNNLLFLLFGLLLSGIILSGVLSHWTLQKLKVERVLPSEAVAGKPILVGLRVTNNKRRIVSYALVVRDVARSGFAGHAMALALQPGESRELSYRWEPVKRGMVEFSRVDLLTRFPFGIFEKWLEVDLPAQAVVFPAEVPAPTLRNQRLSPPGERPTASAGQGTEFFALRDQRVGDDARSIHWMTSARRGRPVVVERERERRRRVTVVVDNRIEVLWNAAREMTTDGLLDRLVESAAAAVRQAEHEGCEVALSTAGQYVSPGAGPVHLKRLLRTLALLAPATNGSSPASPTDSELLEVTAADVSRRPTVKAA